MVDAAPRPVRPAGHFWRVPKRPGDVAAVLREMWATGKWKTGERQERDSIGATIAADSADRAIRRCRDHLERGRFSRCVKWPATPAGTRGPVTVWQVGSSSRSEPLCASVATGGGDRRNKGSSAGRAGDAMRRSQIVISPCRKAPGAVLDIL